MVEVGQRGKPQGARQTRRARRQRLAIDGLAGAVVLTGLAVGMGNVSGASVAASRTSHTVKTVKVSSTTIKNVGTVLTTASGLTLYRFTADPMGKSVCTGACAKIWPPLTATKGEHVQGPKGVKGLSLINTGHGRWQVAFHNVALYRFTGDTKKGQDHGQNVAHMWFAVLKSGIPASATTPTTAAPGSSTTPSTSTSTSTSTTQAPSGAVTPVTPSTAATMGGQTSPATTPTNPAPMPTPVTSPPVTSPPPRPTTTTTTAPPTGGGAAF
jgi:predicted lipoprotein with Yx(FWY)xxD motif